MIYSKVEILDGTYKVTLFDEIGSDITSNYTVTSVLSRELSKNTFEDIFKTEDIKSVLSREILEDHESIFATIYIDNVLYKKYIKIKIINRTSYQSYTILYKTTSSLIQLSNTMSSRFSYFMPKWSTAYKNQISNFSKVTYPLFSNIEKSFSKTLEVNTHSLDNKTYFKKLSQIPKGTSKVIGKKDNVEKIFTYNINLSPVTRVESVATTLRTTDLRIINKESKLPIAFKSNLSYLYFKSPIGSEVEILGLTSNNSIITETFEFDNSSLKRSRYKYKRLLKVTSNSSKYEIYNHIKCSEHHSAEIFESLPITCSESKRQNYNVFNLEEDILHEQENSIARPYRSNITSYIFNTKLKEVFINEYGNVIALDKDSRLISTVLSKNFNTNFKLLENNNNNPYVFLEDVNLNTKETIFSISTKDIILDLDLYSIVVEVQTEKGVYFLNADGDFLKQSSEVLISKTNSIDLNVNFKEYVSVVVHVGSKKYQASYISNYLDCTVLKDGVDSIFINGSNYYAVMGEVVHRLKLIKDYYETDLEGTLISLEGEVTFINSKGEHIDGRV